MPIAAGPKAGPIGRSSAASSGSSRAGSSAFSSARRRWLDRHRSILSIALGVQAARRGHRVAFATAHQWVNLLGTAKRAGRLVDEL
ncbi:MAG: ATP-binding protein, partial [Chloroflexi bacterium]|nr:ATP-binding protein [Chloroflexota bacterium]